jgi:uncharacterized protein (DUF58 family)
MSRFDLDWQPSPYARRMLTLAALALVLGFAFGRPEACALAAVPLAPFALARGRRCPGQVEISIRPAANRCFEDEPVQLTVHVTVGSTVDQLRIRFSPGPGVLMHSGAAESIAINTTTVELDCTIRPIRWGNRRAGTAEIELIDNNRLARAEPIIVTSRPMAVFPQPAAISRLSAPAGRTDRSGDHLARLPGSGVEFAGIRPFVFGDNPRRINWPASNRSGQLQVTETAAERAIDVVVAIDAFGDVGPAGHSTLDLTMRGATGIVRHFLRSHDRVGLVAIGGWLRWIGADIGDRQFYRVAETILDVLGHDSYIDPNLNQIPRTALPPGAFVVYFSPLLDPRAVAVAEDLRRRGYPITVVDVLNTEPPVESRRPSDAVALRIWRLERIALRYRLGGLGVPVAHWDGDEPLDVLLQPGLRRRAA